MKLPINVAGLLPVKPFVSGIRAVVTVSHVTDRVRFFFFLGCENKPLKSRHDPSRFVSSVDLQRLYRGRFASANGIDQFPACGCRIRKIHHSR
jgi:hypothetical protein